MKIPIYHYTDKCVGCKKEIDIYYPELFASQYGLVAVNETCSTTRGGKPIENICPYCNAHQGTGNVKKHYLEVCKDSNIGDSCVWVEGNLKCNKCGKDIDYTIDKQEPSAINDFFAGLWGNKCLSCMNEEDVESLIERLSSMSRCTACDRLIFDDPDSYDNITLDDTTIVRSKPNKHHINYEKNKIIIVCSECHTKIHNSKKKQYKEYRPVD
jgi:hypothetical protein